MLPKRFPHLTSDMLAKPSRTYRVAVTPDAAAPAVLDVMGAAQGSAPTKRLCAGVVVKDGEGWRYVQAERCDRNTLCDPFFDRPPTSLGSWIIIGENAPDQKIMKHGDVRAALDARVVIVISRP